MRGTSAARRLNLFFAILRVVGTSAALWAAERAFLHFAGGGNWYDGGGAMTIVAGRYQKLAKLSVFCFIKQALAYELGELCTKRCEGPACFAF